MLDSELVHYWVRYSAQRFFDPTTGGAMKVVRFDCDYAGCQYETHNEAALDRHRESAHGEEVGDR